MSLDLSRRRMDGVSGLTLIAPHERNFLDNIMKPNEVSAFSASNYNFNHFMQANVGLGSVGGVTAFNSPYSLLLRPTHDRLPSPSSRGSETTSEGDTRGEVTGYVFVDPRLKPMLSC